MASSDADKADGLPDRFEAAIAGDKQAWGEVLHEARGRLRRMIALRMDRRLQGRIDPSDVIQEAFLEATSRLAEYRRDPRPMPLFLWLRYLAGQRLQAFHRFHLGTKAREVSREVSRYRGGLPEATSAALAAQLLGRETRASQALLRMERKLRLEQALNSMDPIDREVLVLRHFEQLSNSECAKVLEVSEAAATKRYLRALKRLKEVLVALPGGPMEFER
jgi:RNA polymerase sigma-70 factor (ECF subfamily)